MPLGPAFTQLFFLMKARSMGQWQNTGTPAQPTCQAADATQLAYPVLCANPACLSTLLPHLWIRIIKWLIYKVANEIIHSEFLAPEQSKFSINVSYRYSDYSFECSEAQEGGLQQGGIFALPEVRSHHRDSNCSLGWDYIQPREQWTKACLTLRPSRL